MEEFKGTKGEWKDTLTPMRKSKIVDTNGFSICTLSAGTPTDRANAKLIAAAPELLSIAIDLMKNFKGNRIDGGGKEVWGERIMPSDSQITALRDAIAKALSH